VLARVQAFLPQIEASNAILAQADPMSLDIENVAETDNRYIEMVHLICPCFLLEADTLDL
jgi:hypothetical protein